MRWARYGGVAAMVSGMGVRAFAGEEAVPQGILELLLSSGVIGYLILGLSVVVMALAIESFMTVKREKLLPEDLLEEIDDALDAGDVDSAVDLCRNEDCALGRVIGCGLVHQIHGFERMEEAMIEEAEKETSELRRRIGRLNLIGGVAPMLGLLGTVGGMLSAFGEIAMSPTVGPQELGAGIYKALMTTLLGLVVAIPAIVMYSFLRERVDRIAESLGLITGDLLDRFRPAEE